MKYYNKTRTIENYWTKSNWPRNSRSFEKAKCIASVNLRRAKKQNL